MRDVCDKLKVRAKEANTQYFEQLHGWGRYWTDINDEILEERWAGAGG